MFISLDGGKEEHNLYRINKDGKGSFDNVKSNLDYMLDNYPDYCKKRVIIQGVYMKGHSILEDEGSFYRSYLYDKGICKVLKINQYPQKTESSFIAKEWIDKMPSLQERIEKFKSEMTYLENNLSNLNSVLKARSYLIEDFQKTFKFEETLVLENPHGKNILNQTFSCPIGRDVIYMSAKGEYHVCNKAGYSYKIGNSTVGISKKAIADMLNSYLQTIEAKCQTCWAFRYCKICPANVMVNEKFRIPNDWECSNLKDMVKWEFYKLIILKDMPQLYEQLKRTLPNINNKSFLNYSSPIFIN